MQPSNYNRGASSAGAYGIMDDLLPSRDSRLTAALDFSTFMGTNGLSKGKFCREGSGRETESGN